MMAIRFLASFLLLYFTLIDIGFCQESLIRTYEPKYNGDKLRLQTILLDAHGNLLCGTDKGVMIFDGNTFYPAFNQDSLSSQAVQSLFKDQNEIIWIGYKNGKIGRIENGQFFWLKIKESQGVVPVTSFAEDAASGRLYFSTMGEGVFYIQDGHLQKINKGNGLSDEYCYKILKLSDNRICVATDQGINFIQFIKGEIKINTISSEQGLPDNIVREMALDKNNQLWIGLQDKGYCIVDPNTYKITSWPALPSWDGGQVNTILHLEDEVWIGTEEHGVITLENSGNYQKIRSTQSTLKNAGIKTLISASDRHVWIASGEQLIRSSAEVLKLLNDQEGKPFSFIHCILADKEGNIWFSPDQQLYCAKKQASGKYQFKKYIVTQKNKLTDIVALWEDNRKNIWIGTLGEGVFVLNPGTGKISHPGVHHLLENGNVMTIAGIDNKILIGGFGGIQSFTSNYNTLTGEYQLQAEETELSTALSNNYIYSIHKDVRGRIWLGTDERGLVLLQNDKVKFFTKKDGISSMTIQSITSDKSGKVWMATQGGGISVYDGTKFENYSLKDGLSDPSPTSVLVDDDERVFAIHPNGIDIFDPVSKTFQYFSSESGLGEINPDLNAVSSDPEGRIWIGTEKGIYIYTPSESGSWQQPNVQINSVLLFLEPLPAKSQMKFNYDQNNISFKFNAPWYTDPNRISYSYQLDGFAQKWQTTKDRSVSYPRLPPGKYIFRVRASLNENYDHSSEAVYSFVIKSPFWQTLWFRLLLSLVIILMIWLTIRRREKRLRKSEKEKKEKIEFQFETLRSQVNPHFLFNSFNTLITVIEKDPTLAIEYVEHLSQFFRNIIGYKDVELIPLAEEVGLLENYLFIQSKRYGKHMQLKNSIDKIFSESCYIPPLTLQLLAENAIKHNAISHESPLLIELYQENDYLVMKNNINPKFSTEKSTGIGLQNIKNRYKLLCDKEIKIVNDSKQFIVSVPIINEY